MGSSKAIIINSKLSWVILISMLHLVFLASFLFAQEIIWVTVEGTAPVKNQDKAAAKDRAIENALRNAVHEAVGSYITAETLVVNLRLSGSILGAIPYGKVIGKEIVEESIEKIPGQGQQKPGQVYRVKIRTGVVEETIGADPSFRLDASLNNASFINGDEMLIQVKPTKDCYVSVFNILEGEKILRLIPNRFKEQNFLPANATFSFPNKADRSKGVKLRVYTPENKDVVTESIYILALSRPVEFKSAGIQEGIYGVYKGQTAFMQDLIKEVVGIPLNERAEVLMQYEIKRK
ncbi:MAG: DUF4384 domain-containing protein [Deltaproteobacteria bacterium]|nr:MAG: DUF4384 domain-containing protein [Deltaproteobacteria bacterium]